MASIVEQAGGIVYRVEHGTPAILVVTSKRDPSRWIFPKGHIERGETSAETALRETVEEAGVEGDIVGPVGAPLEFDWSGKRYRVQYFLIRATSESPSLEGRQKAWLPFDKALKRLSHKELRALLREARDERQIE
jgi:8-oxo-dGTP pyrophosphatase MutT (NUDIX family)